MTFVDTPNAPAPGGHYSQAVIHGDVVYVAGILPITPAGEKLTNSTVAQQMEQILDNFDAVLRAAGSRRENVLRVTVYVSNIGDWGTVNQLYAQFFGNHRPARSMVPVSTLHYGLQIELDAIAVVEA